MKKALICSIGLSTLMLLAITPELTAQLSFQPFYSFEKTFTPTEMKLADFDGDSFKDLVYINSSTKQLNFIYHLSDLGLRTTQSISVNSSHTGNLYHLETGDLNNDGKADLISIETSILGINLIVHLSTGSSFVQQAIALGAVSGGSLPKIIDFNKDGNLDVAVVSSKNIIFYKGDGHGAFTLSSTPQVHITATPTGNEQSFEVADINFDGAADMVVYAADTLYTFTNNGNGSNFTLKKLKAAGTQNSVIKIGELTGDNFPELMMISIASGTASLLKFPNSSGTYSSPVNLSISNPYSRNIDIADYNNDSKQDVLLGGGGFSTAFILLKNNGSSPFTNGAPPSNNDYGNVSIYFSDINNNGDLEIVELSQNKFINIYTLSGGNYQFAEKIVIGTDSSKGIAADLNNDNKIDIVTYSSGGEFVSYFYGTGDKTFSKPTYLSGSTKIGAIAVDDFNKDTFKDILYAETFVSYGSSIKLVASDNTGKLGVPVSITEKGSSVLISGDFNNDGNIDFATDHGTYINNGSGAFTLQSYTLSFSPSSIGVGYFNNDNALDLVFNDSNKNYISLNNGSGTFSTFTATTGSQLYKSIKSALINNDSFSDLVSVQYSAGSYAVDVLINNGDGTFTVHQTLIPPTNGQFGGYADVADLDKDGLVDIVVGVNSYSNGGSSAVYLQDASGNFNFSQTIPVSSIVSNVYAPDFLQIVDTNADGKQDVVMYSVELLDPVSIALNDLVVKPTQKATVSLTSKTDVSATLSLTNGDGNAMLVVVRKSDTKKSLPSNNLFYTTNTQFGSGAQLGTGNYAVILKDTTAITITGLTQSGSYTVSVYECNKNLSKTFVNYLTTSYDSVNFTTKKTQTLTVPAVQDKIIGSAPFDLTVTSSAGLPVTLTAETTNISISSNTVTLGQTGPAKIKVSSDATADYAAAAQEISFCVNPLVPTITVVEQSALSYLLTSSSDVNNHWLLNGSVIDTATHKTYHPIINGVYSVQVEAGTCHSVSTPTSFIITGVEHNIGQYVYPNPFTDFISVSGASDVANIQMVNMNGQAETVAVDRDSELLRINTKSLSSGLHIVRIQTPVSVYYFKVIKSQ